MPTVLIVEDEAPARKFLQGILEAHGYETVAAENLAAAGKVLEQHAADIVLLDVRLPDGSGLSLMERALRDQPGLPIIVATGHGDIEMAVEAMKAGAADFISKPIDEARLVGALRRATDQVVLQRETVRLRRERWENHQWVPSTSPQMKEVLSIIERVAKTDANVLILGESGTGKNMVADLIHRNSARMRGNQTPVVLNCPTIAEHLLESELFGHEANAFTGAGTKRKRGVIETAEGNTLFLDEISSMKLELQAKLLRALEERLLRRVGGTTEVKVDFRLISATNHELTKMIADGSFREDLYWRLRTVEIRMPRLRDRREDIPALTGAMLARLAQLRGENSIGVSSRAMDALRAYAWPGNIRELLHALERAMLFCDGDQLEIGHLPQEVRDAL